MSSNNFGFWIGDFGLKEKSLMRSKQYMVLDFGIRGACSIPLEFQW